MRSIDAEWPPRWCVEDMPALAAEWIAELRGGAPIDGGDSNITVTMMNFTAGPEVQWAFLKAAVDAAPGGDELFDIAAGPFEHLLGHHGDAYIEVVERLCAAEAKWRRVAENSYRYMMSDEVWARVRAIQVKGTGVALGS
jgi:hypothetical protein